MSSGRAAQHVVTVLDVQAGNAFVVMADDNAIAGLELGVLIGGKFPQVGVGGRRLASARWGQPPTVNVVVAIAFPSASRTSNVH